MALEIRSHLKLGISLGTGTDLCIFLLPLKHMLPRLYRKPYRKQDKVSSHCFNKCNSSFSKEIVAFITRENSSPNKTNKKKFDPQLSATILFFDRAHHLPRNDNRQNGYDTLGRSQGSRRSTRQWENLRQQSFSTWVLLLSLMPGRWYLRCLEAHAM